MTIQVTGTLRTPMGVPIPNAQIRLITVVGSDVVLPYSVATHVTNALGVYDFPMVDGQYTVEVMYTDTFEITGSSIVNEGTPTPVNLSELFQYTTPLPPQQVIDLTAEFDLKLANLESSFDTETQEIRTQLVDGDASVLQQSQLFTNDRLGSELAIVNQAVTSGDAAVLSQSLAYSDSTGAVISADVTRVEAAATTAQTELTAFRDAEGVENATIRTEVSTAQNSAVTISQAYADVLNQTTTTTVQTQLTDGDAAILQQANIHTDDVNNTLDVTLRDLIQTGNDSIESILSLFTDIDGNTVAHGSLISDVNGRITGYHSTNDGTDTSFEIIADTFKIGHMSDDPTPVFIPDLQYNTVTNLLEISGNTILTGTLQAAALVANSITAAQIAADTITAAQIQADTLTGREINATATIVVGELPSSSTFSITVGTGVSAVGFGSSYGSISAGATIHDIPISAFRTFNSTPGVSEISLVVTPPDTRDLVVVISSIAHDFVYSQASQSYVCSTFTLNGVADGTVITAIATIAASSAIAGINGDDNTFTGLDGIRFWAGTLPMDADSAPYRVTSAGKLYATGAELSGNLTASNIYGSVLEGSTVKGSVIIGSTIYGSAVLLTCDPDDNGTVYNYIDNPAIPVSCDTQIGFTIPTTGANNNGTWYSKDIHVYSAADRKGDVNLDRFRWSAMDPDGIVITATSEVHTWGGTAQNTQNEFYFELRHKVTNAVLSTSSVLVGRVPTYPDSGPITFHGMSISTTNVAEDLTEIFNPDPIGAKLTTTVHISGIFGSTSVDSLNGYLKVYFRHVPDQQWPGTGVEGTLGVVVAIDNEVHP